MRFVMGLGRYIHTYAWTYKYVQIFILEGGLASGQLGNLGLVLHCDVINGFLALLSFLFLFSSPYFFMRQRLYTDTRAI